MATIDLKKDPSTSDAAKEVNNATHLEARVVSAPAHIDRGWAWVILAVAFFARVLNGGFVWSLNFYFVAFHEAFRESRTYTSLVGALAFATYHSAAPLASFAVQRLGVRTSFILGSLMITANYLANAHANGILYLIITNTALFGLITDATGSYTWTLVLIGASQLTAAVLLFLIYLVQRNQKK